MHTQTLNQPDMEVSMAYFLERPFGDTDLLFPFESLAS